MKPYVLAQGRAPHRAASASTTTPTSASTSKYGVTPSLTLDLTVNPDFAQVEADEQQVNLTQFSQFFPEKRDFFLENSGIFYVGDAARNNRVNPTPTPDEDMLLFFSRRIGLTADGRRSRSWPARVSPGRPAGLGSALLSMQTRSTDDAPREPVHRGRACAGTSARHRTSARSS